MPKRSPKLAIEGRVRADWEYVEWAARVTRDAEDIRSTTNYDRWREHVINKYNFSMGSVERESQLRGLWNKGIIEIWDRMPEVGIIGSTRWTAKGSYYQYKDIKTGRFISLVEASRRLGWFI